MHPTPVETNSLHLSFSPDHLCCFLSSLSHYRSHAGAQQSLIETQCLSKRTAWAVSGHASWHTWRAPLRSPFRVCAAWASILYLRTLVEVCEAGCWVVTDPDRPPETWTRDGFGSTNWTIRPSMLSKAPDWAHLSFSTCYDVLTIINPDIYALCVLVAAALSTKERSSAIARRPSRTHVYAAAFSQPAHESFICLSILIS